MSNSKRDLTLLVLAGETSPVRRIRLRRAWFKQGAVGAAVIAGALSLASVDYVRLRRDATDVERMRADTKRQSAELEALKGQLGGITQQFEELRELERKVRVIANLPEAPRETHTPNAAGQGGAEDTDGIDNRLLPLEGDAAPDAQPAEAEAAEPGAKEGLRSAIDRIELRARKLSSLLPERRASLEALVAGLEDHREQLAATPSIWPASGFVTSGYGYRTSPFTNRRQFHAGIDIAADYGTTIIAPASGRVVYAGRKGAFGLVVEIDHGFGIRTLYGHTEALLVRAGQRVQRGTKIARVGSSGRSTGPHVHYQVKVAGRTANPSDYIFE